MSAAASSGPVTVLAMAQETPPDHSGRHDLETRELQVEAASYEEAVAALDELVPAGWRLLWRRVIRHDAG